MLGVCQRLGKFCTCLWILTLWRGWYSVYNHFSCALFSLAVQPIRMISHNVDKSRQPQQGHPKKILVLVSIPVTSGKGDLEDILTHWWNILCVGRRWQLWSGPWILSLLCWDFIWLTVRLAAACWFQLMRGPYPVLVYAGLIEVNKVSVFSAVFAAP